MKKRNRKYCLINKIFTIGTLFIFFEKKAAFICKNKKYE
jgi:hypothetical protein